MRFQPLYYIVILIGVLGLNSCADQQDFSQVDDLNVLPTIESSILYVESPESLINEIPSNTYYSQVFNFDAFSEEFIAERLIEGVITFEVENTTSKPLRMEVAFLDEAGNTLYTQVFNIPAAPTAILRREVSFGTPGGQDINIIRNTSSIRLSAENLGDNTSVSSLPDPKVIFRSSAKFTLEIQ